MHLVRLKLRNFKSFSGVTEIAFQPGFTGVAGPNGMGKSNISDGILFVLGPTSSKALRAERLTHLFFNGGASKKPASECEVSLVFDNRDHLLPLESNEVEITRYVKLAPGDPNGYYSYFYVNGKRTTQGEIDAILSHARLSGDGYNLVQQGDVNKIVTMGPIPRRGLVERLAGISQYDEELQRADSKRADLETNLDRINTLLGEIRTRLTSLESQRLQAIQYKQTQDEKRRAEARLARAGHLLVQQEAETCKRQVQKLEDEIADLQKEAAALAQQRSEAEQAIGKVEQEIAERGGTEAAKFKEDLDARRMAFARLEENLRNLDEVSHELGAKCDALAAQIHHDEIEFKNGQGQEKKLAQQLDAIETQIDQLSKELQSTSGNAEQAHGKLVGTRRQLLELERQKDEQQKTWQLLVQRRESAKAAVDAAERDLAQAEDDEQQFEIELKDVELRAKKSERGEGLSGPDLKKRLNQLKQREKDLASEADRLGQEVIETNRRFLALDARLKARTESGSRATPMAAVEFLLSQRNLGKIPGIRGTVEELAEFEPVHLAALQVAGGGRLQALVVESDGVAEECIQLLRSEKRGRATFLPLNKMLPGRPKGKSLVAAQSNGAVGFAIDLVHFEESLRPAFWYVFGETVVMKDLASARSQMGGVRLVTLAGDLIEATGAISGGYLELRERGRGTDSATELKRLADDLRAKSAEENRLRTELADIRSKIQASSDELTKLSVQDQADAATQKLLDADRNQIRSRLKDSKGRIERATQAREKAADELAESEKGSTQLAQEVESLKTRIHELQETYLGNLPGAVSERLRKLQAEIQRNTEERVRLNGELESCRASLHGLEANLTERRTELAKIQQQIHEKKTETTSVRKSREEARAALEALRLLEAKQSEASKGQVERKRRLEEGRLKIVDRAGRVEEATRSRSTMLSQEETRLRLVEQKALEVETALRQFPEAEPDEIPQSVEEIQRSIKDLNAQLESMGSVNLRALEEYDQEKERLEEFQGENQRLTNEKKELLGLVAAIETKKREKISEVVIQVNTHFQTIYADLSGGGDGEIVLENPKDPLAGGLLIRARPVGKNVQRLEQLSGGEKSLASLAFIFSLQRYDPSPLYVFDEVDMSLDGLNAENVGRMLRRNAERAQFIVISLRKVTLKSARQLLGVTMKGDGCSRVVSLKLDEIKDVDERPLEAEAGAPAPPLEALPVMRSR